ncbi:MAG: agglutinin biogenesis protein MshI [Burkholderiales bacterium]|nr:agglutinin biogenesis protein MshI [Burkholderiales bacterium]
MLSLRRAKIEPGWVAMAPQGGRVHAVHLVSEAGRKPALRWACSEPWSDPVQTLRALRRVHPLQQHRTVALLQHAQYQLLTLDAPDLPRAEWRDAMRWRLKDMVDFPVDSAGIDVIDIPVDPQQRRAPSLIAIAAPRAALQPLADAASDAGTPWHAIDVPETALRNIAVLAAEPGRGEALLHVGSAHSTLVVTAQGELLISRHIEVTLDQLTEPDEGLRQQSFERASLELQRTLDNVERQFSHANLARLQVAPGAPLLGFIEYVRDLVYVPVTAFDLASVIDLSAVPELADPAAQAAYLPAIGAALR